MTIIRCLAVLYSYYQFCNLQKLGCKYILGKTTQRKCSENESRLESVIRAPNLIQRKCVFYCLHATGLPALTLNIHCYQINNLVLCHNTTGCVMTSVPPPSCVLCVINKFGFSCIVSAGFQTIINI